MFDHPTHNSSFEEPSQAIPPQTENVYPLSSRAPLASTSVVSGGEQDFMKKYKVKLQTATLPTTPNGGWENELRYVNLQKMIRKAVAKKHTEDLN